MHILDCVHNLRVGPVNMVGCLGWDLPGVYNGMLIQVDAWQEHSLTVYGSLESVCVYVCVYVNGQPATWSMSMATPTNQTLTDQLTIASHQGMFSLCAVY
jgi:hypothetical protein